MSNVNVTGLKELQAFLDQISAKIEANVMRAALPAGARVFRDEAKANVPVSPPNASNAKKYGAYTGALRDSIRVSSRSKNGVVTASVKAGGKSGKSRSADVFYAQWVEYGTAAHQIKPKGGKSLFLAGIFKTIVNHPGAMARPFMRPAFDNKSSEAIVAVGEAIKKRLTKQGLDTSGIGIEVDE